MFENERHAVKRSTIWQEVKYMIRRHPIVTILIFAIAVGGLLFFLFPTLATSKATKEKAKEEKKEEKKLPVETAVAKKGSITSWIVTTATLEPNAQVTILSETTGVVGRLMVEEGDRVNE